VDIFASSGGAASAEMARRYNQMASATVTPRTRDQVERFFTGLDLLPPGTDWPGQ
jgi:hypothetical protein